MRKNRNRPESDEPLSEGRVEYLEAARQRVRNRRIRRTAVLLVLLTAVVLFATGIAGSSVAALKDLTDTARIALLPGSGWRLRCSLASAKTLTAVGYQPIFAHIERYRCLRWPGRVQLLRERYGVSMQMNVDTICRRHSFFSQRWVNSMLRKGYIDVAASDAHNVTSRPCRMRDGYQALQKRFGQEMADRLCIEFPGQI